MSGKIAVAPRVLSDEARIQEVAGGELAGLGFRTFLFSECVGIPSQGNHGTPQGRLRKGQQSL